MDYAAKFRSCDFFFRFHFCHLAVTCPYDDKTLKPLSRSGHISITLFDLPDTTGLSLREAIIQCLESVRPQSRTKLHPEPSTPSPRSAEHKPEPTANGEPDPSETNELSPIGVTVRRITLEPEPHVTSVQVREPATEPATGDNSVYSESTEGGFDHCNMADCKLKLDLGLLDVKQDFIDFNTDIYADMPPLLPPSSKLSTCPELSALNCPCPHALKRPQRSFPCLLHSQFWESHCDVCVGSTHHPGTLYLSVFPTQPPPPTTSTPVLATAVSRQPLCSPSAHHLCGGIAAGCGWRIPCLRL